MSNEDIRAIVKKIQSARMDLAHKQPFYASLLFHMQFSLDEMCETVYTDGDRIIFCPDFLMSLTEKELEYVMMHEVLHAALNHVHRMKKEYDFDDFGTACDIVVNSNILESSGKRKKEEIITLKGMVGRHLTPKGKEGYLYTAEEVYRFLQLLKQKLEEAGDGDHGGDGSGQDGTDEDDQRNNKKDKPEEDENSDGDSDDADSGDSDGEGAGDGDSDGDGNGKSDSNGTGDSNSNGISDSNGKGKGKGQGKGSYGSVPGLCSSRVDGGFDDHTYWHIKGKGFDSQKEDELTEESFAKWQMRMIEAAEHIEKLISIENATKTFGGVPFMAQRILKEYQKNEINWREILQNFVQEEINDYSFNPPDRRFQDSEFLLPDYNEKEESVKNIWFLIDTSGSISDAAIAAAYHEICSAIEQFDEKMEGWLSFTESYVTEPIPFSSVDDILAIKPIGGGGNDFSDIFRYMQTHMMDDLPNQIVIITDGYDNFSKEEETLGVPVLWLINNDDAKPPWGKVARIKIEAV